VPISLAGVGFETDAVVQWNGTNLATTYVSPDLLKAVIPASDLTSAGQGSITVFDSTNKMASGSMGFTVVPPTAVSTVNIPPTANPGDQPSIALTLNPYPVPVTVTVTLSFTDTSANPAASNGLIEFVMLPQGDMPMSVNGNPTDKFMIAANTTGTIVPRLFAAGNVAGTIKVSIQLAAGGVDITPSTLKSTTVTVAPTVPIFQSAVFNSSGDNLQVVVIASSSTREIAAATFHFTPVMGKTLKTTDVTITKPPQFTDWFTGAGSAQYGSAFTYTQNFTLNVDASVVEGVTVTLQNGQGPSAASPAQQQ
jgi:hypothetical protein